MRKRILALIYFFYILTNGYAQNHLISIDLTQAKDAVPMSKLFDKIEYVPLETNKNCLLKPSAAYYVTKDYIIAMNIFYNTYLFDRKTGKYIREIGSEGGGQRNIRDLCFTIMAWTKRIILFMQSSMNNGKVMILKLVRCAI